MNFLVTGGAGFIGSHVCGRLLQDGHSVWTMDDLNSFYDPALKRRNLAEIESGGGAFSFAEGDIADRSAVDRIFGMARFDQVIHLAARAGVRPSLAEPALYSRVNVEGTANIMEAARLAGVKKTVIASSSSVYGVNSKVPFAESDPIFTPISPYAATKLACEAMGHVYHHVYGMEVVMLRFFTVYGPRQRPDLAIHKFARLIAAGQPIEVFGDGGSARDYTYIDDIVDGIMACVRKNFGYEIFNLGGSNPTPLSYLIQLLERELKKPAQRITRPNQPGDVPQTWADTAKSRRLLGFRPKVGIEEGVARFVHWMQTTEKP